MRLIRLATALLTLTVMLSATHSNQYSNLVKEVKKVVTDLNTSKGIGKYHLRCSSLVEVGLIDKDKYLNSTSTQTQNNGLKKRVIWNDGLTLKKFLDDENNWKITGGKTAFLNSSEIQEEAMNKLIATNLEKLSKKGIKLKDIDSVKTMLVASHFGDVHSAVAYAMANYKDSYKFKLKLGSNGIDQLATEAKKYLGGKYVWGGTKPNGFDCSGYVKYIYAKAGVELPRTAYSQSRIGEKVELSSLKKGDLLFFLTDKSRGIPITHVGIYLEGGKFIHAASKKEGIIVSNFAEYKSRFISAKRVTTNTQATKVASSLNLEFKHKDIEQYLNTPKPTLENAKKSNVKVAYFYDPLVIHNGRYIRQSQLKE